MRIDKVCRHALVGVIFIISLACVTPNKNKPPEIHMSSGVKRLFPTINQCLDGNEISCSDLEFACKKRDPAGCFGFGIVTGGRGNTRVGESYIQLSCDYGDKDACYMIEQLQEERKVNPQAAANFQVKTAIQQTEGRLGRSPSFKTEENQR